MFAGPIWRCGRYRGPLRKHFTMPEPGQAKPERRRIVPQQIITPTKPMSHTDSLGDGPRSLGSRSDDVGDLKAHSELAARLLGPGRKIYIDLSDFQAQQKEVNWKEVSSPAAGSSLPRQLYRLATSSSGSPSLSASYPLSACSCSKNTGQRRETPRLGLALRCRTSRGLAGRSAWPPPPPAPRP